MKVLFVQTTITRYMHPLLEKISDNGVTLVMLVPQNSETGKSVKKTDYISSKYKVIKSPTKKMKYGKSGYPLLNNIINEEKPDILLIGWPYFVQLFFQRNIFKTLKQNNTKLIIREIPFQVSPYGNTSWYKNNPIIDENMNVKSIGLMFKIRIKILMRIRRFIYQKADAAVCYCNEGHRILPSYGITNNNIFVTGNCTDTDKLFNVKEKVENSETMLEKKTRILHIGRLVKWKRVDLLITAFKNVLKQFPTAELAIVGDGPERDFLQIQAKNLGIDNNVKFYGAVYDEFTLGKYMHESTIYVLAGMGGLSINDAMTYNLPVIVSVCDGTEKDLVTDGVNGYFFENGNSESLTQKICTILNNKHNIEKMGKQSEHIIKEKYTLEKVAQNYCKAFAEVLKS